MKGCVDFGLLRGWASNPSGYRGAPYVYLTSMGKAIVTGLQEFKNLYPIFQIYQYKIMPDHIHMIIYKKDYSEIHLDDYMEYLKDIIAVKSNTLFNSRLTRDQIFAEKYTDKPLYEGVNLNNWFSYLQENPRRRLTILQKPDFFKHIHKLRIKEKEFEAYGNPFLWDNPDKKAVRMRSSFSAEQRQNHAEDCLFNASKGTILVSPFISPYEKEVQRIAEKNNYPYILIQYLRFPDRYKPPKHQFELCEKGKLLIISLGMGEKTVLNHEICCMMNELAEKIAEG